MFNAPHLLETALLMLAAFLIGAVVGVVLRLLIARPKPAVAPVVEAKPAEVSPAAPQLVTAPQIAPLPHSPTASQRLAAAAGGMQPGIKMPAHTLPSMPAIASIQPSHTAGETVAGRHIDNPEHPQAASLEDVRAELEAQIDASPVPAEAVATARAEIVAAMADAPAAAVPPVEDATIVPAALAAPDQPLPEASDALAAEAETPMLAEVSDEQAHEKLPVEERIEPAMLAESVVLIDPPAELAAEIQDIIETPDADPVPDVVAEAPLVEPAYQKQDEERAADHLFPTEDKVEPTIAPVAVPQSAEDEMAAMRAIEGGWTPRRPVVTRRPADLPEGVSAAEVAAADQAVVDSAAAVANVAAIVNAVLEDAAPAKAARPAGGFGRPAALPAPRDGSRDDLGQIKGLGPAIESSLNGLGIYHYDQVADWDQKAVVWIENHFGFKGRVARERWQEQARDLGRRRSPVARPVRR